MAGDVALLPADIVVQHGDMIDQRDGSDAANEDRAPDSLERDVAVEHVDQGPRPEIGEAGDLTHIIGSEPCAPGQARAESSRCAGQHPAQERSALQ